MGQWLFPMLERLTAEHDVERGVRERDVAGVPVPAGTKLRRLAPLDQRLDAGP